MKTYLATGTDIGGRFEGIGPLANFSGIKGAASLFNQTISIIIGFLTVVAGLWFVFQFIIGAIGWLTSGGDKTKVQAAQSKITQSIIGLVVVIAAIFIIDLVGTVFGFDILSPGDFVIGLW